MTKGVGIQGYIPLRQDPSHTSEMISQILFGETFHITNTSGSWYHVKLDFDGTEGWAGRASIQASEEEKGEQQVFKIAIEPTVSIRDLDRAIPVILPAGSLWNTSAGKTWLAGRRNFELLSEKGWTDPGMHNDPEEIGKQLLSVPGLYGGRCGFGFDAPGFIQLLCRIMGVPMPRECSAQAESGSSLSFIHEVEKGDLAFFDNQAGEISHVGMALGQGRIIHAYDQVRIDTLDHQGIFSADTEGYTHRLRIIKRVFS